MKVILRVVEYVVMCKIIITYLDQLSDGYNVDYLGLTEKMLLVRLIFFYAHDPKTFMYLLKFALID